MVIVRKKGSFGFLFSLPFFFVFVVDFLFLRGISLNTTTKIKRGRYENKNNQAEGLYLN